MFLKTRTSCKERKEMGNRLPIDIIFDIITRLPTESILDCKLVCRSWRNLVSHHPLFIQKHLARLHDLDCGKLSFIAVVTKPSLECLLHYFEYNENTDHETAIHNTRRMNLKLPFRSSTGCYLIGSFNGLVCLYECFENAYCVCNPMTKEYVMFPNHIDNLSTCMRVFGYLYSTNEYKVVQFHEELGFVKAVVYTLGGGKGWRNVGQRDSIRCNVVFDSTGVFANGAVYWKDWTQRRLFVFDLVEEKFGEPIALPPYPQLEYDYRSPYYIGHMGGVLYFAQTIYTEIISSENEATGFKSLEIWLLKKKNDIRVMEKQVEDEPFGWSKEFVLPVGPLHRSTCRNLPKAITKSGSFLSFTPLSLDIYNAVASTSKQLVGFTGTGIELYDIVPHKNTFISLKELGEEDVKTMESAEIVEAKAVI